jgi:ribonuclease HI
MNLLQIWTDGSSAVRKDKEGFDGAWAFVATWGERRMERYQGGFLRKGTISAMELGAIYAGLTLMKPTGIRIQVFSDSKYAIKALTIWYRKWERCGWLTATGKPVGHQDLIRATLAAIYKHRQAGSFVELIHVKGHLKVDGIILHPENHRADALASHARRSCSGNTKALLQLPGLPPLVSRRSLITFPSHTSHVRI